MTTATTLLLLAAFFVICRWLAWGREAGQPRLQRIRLVARLFKWLSLAAFGFMAFVVLMAIFLPGMVNAPGGTPVMDGPSIIAPVVLREFRPEAKWLYPVLWLAIAAFYGRGIGFFYRLFANMEKGVLFSDDNVRYIRMIGWWMVAGSLLGVVFQASKLVWQEPSVPLNIDASNMPSELLRGLFVIFVAWIMDEGRKIQEEQELTV